MMKPDKNDPMKVRRALAFWVSVYSFLVLPNLLVVYQIFAGADIGLLQAILTYVGILASGPIGAYLYAAHKNGNCETKKEQP
jgi:uncharacterized membrane protein YraQ (UPF0718 family)